MSEVIEATPVRALATIPDATPSQLLASAIDKGMSVEHLSGLLALQERWEAGQAKKAYTEAFSAFKAEGIKILRNRAVTAGPLQGKSYAELHAVVNAVTEALARYGLSASWKNTKDDKDWIEVTCTLTHVGGHSESVSMGGPPDVGGAKNPIQARASTVTYLQRYTLKAICGLAEAGQDDDGQGGAAGGQPDGEDQDAKLRQAGRDAAMEGMATLTAWWGKLTAKERSRLTKDFAGWRRAAQAVPQ